VREAIALAAAYALDLSFGELPNAVHPVAWMGRGIAVGRAFALQGGSLAQLARGAFVALAIPAAWAMVAWAASRSLDRLGLAGVVGAALLLKPTFAVRALGQAALRVRDALDAGDIQAARRALSSLCSREAAALGGDALIAATVESVAENASDSIVAPLFFYALFGLPGAVFYRCVNTMDSMMGYRGRLEYAGKASARLDDLLNLLPARITAALLLVAGGLMALDVRAGLRVLWRDGARTESPNAGRPMAAMAGLLGVRLAKEGHYALGDARRPLATADITLAWRVVSIGSLAALALAALAVSRLHGS
jgi:adenosylcobinamide-phosphate synthase